MGSTEKPQLKFKWRPSEDDGGCSIEQYVLEYKASGHLQYRQLTRTSPALASAGPADAMQSLQALVDKSSFPSDGEYSFRVLAHNHIGDSEPLANETPLYIKTKIGIFENINLVLRYIMKTFLNYFNYCYISFKNYGIS